MSNVILVILLKENTGAYQMFSITGTDLTIKLKHKY